MMVSMLPRRSRREMRGIYFVFFEKSPFLALFGLASFSVVAPLHSIPHGRHDCFIGRTASSFDDGFLYRCGEGVCGRMLLKNV
jgi:hypothetical protein